MVILDGVEQPENTDPSSLLEPSEIEEMSVLKDRDAIAKYGYKAKNGVIFFTSKAYAGKVVEQPVSAVEVVGKPTIATTYSDVVVEGKPISQVGTAATVKEVIGRSSDVVVEGKPVTKVGTTATVTEVIGRPSDVVVEGKPITTVTKPKTVVTGVESVSSVKEVRVERKIIAVVKSNTTEAEVKKIETELKSKGYNFNINRTEFKNGKLVLISGAISKDGVKQYFTASDFAKLVIADYPEEDKKDRFNFMVMSGNLNVSDKVQ